MCEECPLGLNAFLSTSPLRVSEMSGTNQRSDHLVIPNKSDGELHEIVIKSRGHFTHTDHGIEPVIVNVTNCYMT